MKKIIIAAFAACALLAACTEKESAPVRNNDIKVVFEIGEKAGFGQDTKAVKTAWAEGDQILVIFKPKSEGYLVADCEQNTLRFEYNGTKWILKDNNISDISILGDNGEFWAIHHRTFNGDDIIFETEVSTVLSNYKGGEILDCIADYSVSENVLTLDQISMGMAIYDELFQISVTGLPEGEWDMAIAGDTFTSPKFSSLSANISRENALGDGLLVINTSYRELGHINDNYSSGVKNDDDMSFVFRAATYNDEDLNGDLYEAYKFYLTNGTQGYVYRKERGELVDGVLTSFTFTLEKGKAYKLPAFTDPRWVEVDL